MKKWQIAVIVVGAIALGYWASSVPMFPDPYHKDDQVTFLVWCKREIDELLHGEKG